MLPVKFDIVIRTPVVTSVESQSGTIVLNEFWCMNECCITPEEAIVANSQTRHLADSTDNKIFIETRLYVFKFYK